jgi:hypothetical protein
MEHGRWSRTHKYETDDGTILKIQKADTNAMMMGDDEKPSDIQHGIGV